MKYSGKFYNRNLGIIRYYFCHCFENFLVNFIKFSDRLDWLLELYPYDGIWFPIENQKTKPGHSNGKFF